MDQWAKAKDAWYCQRDGGQWNVRVKIVAEIVIEDERNKNGKHGLLVIAGKTLAGTSVLNDYQYLVTSAYEVFDIAQ